MRNNENCKQVIGLIEASARIEANQQQVLHRLDKVDAHFERLNGTITQAHRDLEDASAASRQEEDGLQSQITDHIRDCPLHDRMAKVEGDLSSITVARKTRSTDLHFMWVVAALVLGPFLGALASHAATVLLHLSP
jgi:hypothetical protein